VSKLYYVRGQKCTKRGAPGMSKTRIFKPNHPRTIYDNYFIKKYHRLDYFFYNWGAHSDDTKKVVDVHYNSVKSIIIFYIMSFTGQVVDDSVIMFLFIVLTRILTLWWCLEKKWTTFIICEDAYKINTFIVSSRI